MGIKQLLLLSCNAFAAANPSLSPVKEPGPSGANTVSVVAAVNPAADTAASIRGSNRSAWE